MGILDSCGGICRYNFVPPEAEDNLKSYKYAAEDHSLLYNHFFSPIANFCVKFTPEWIAPNLLTLGGLMCILIPYFMLWHYVPFGLETIVDNWVFYFIGCFHFIYFHLDNMDGKQARKTGNSSALGLIFDHGCDAISVYFQATTMMICLQFGSDAFAFSVLAVPSITFFLTNLEELYTHKMYLPIINPAVEGVVLTGILITLTGFLGQEYMTQEHELPILGTLSTNKILCLFFYVGAIVSIPMIFRRIYKKVGLSKTFEAIRKTWFMVYTHLTLYYFLTYSSIGISHFRYAILFTGFNMCKQLTQMLIASSSKSVFSPFVPIGFVLTTILFLNTFLASNDYVHIDEITLLYTITIIAFIVYVHFIKNVTDQICKVLGIRCFKVKEKESTFQSLNNESSQ